MAFGRHTESSRRRLIITIAAFVVALTPAAVGLWMLRPGQQTSSSEGTLAAATAPAASPAAASSTVAGTEAGTDQDALTPAEVAWWAACQKQVSTGTALIAAQGEAATHWGEHVAAQQDLDAKKITGAEAKARWAASKAFGPEDVANATAAAKAHQAARWGCADPPASPDRTRQEQADTCAGWSARQVEVIQRGEVVVDQWAAHLDMMGRKGEMNTENYLTMWDEMVAAAVSPLAEFDAAAEALGATPCTPPAA